MKIVHRHTQLGTNLLSKSGTTIWINDALHCHAILKREQFDQNRIHDHEVHTSNARIGESLNAARLRLTDIRFAGSYTNILPRRSTPAASRVGKILCSG